jgi:hypothetical protein
MEDYQGNTYPPSQPHWNSEPPAKPKRKNGCAFWFWMLILGNLLAFPMGWATDYFLGWENPHSRFLKGKKPFEKSVPPDEEMALDTSLTEHPYVTSESSTHSGGKNDYGSYVSPHITRNGRFVKGHFRKRVSTSPHAIRNRMRSRYYYQTHKYRYKKH